MAEGIAPSEWNPARFSLDMEKENLMETPSKAPTPGVKRGRTALGELSGGMLKRSSSTQKEKKKRRKSYGRRVSFAPDHRLETTHHFDVSPAAQSETQNLVDPVVVAAPGFDPEAATPVEEGWKNEDGHTVQITTDITTGVVSMELTNASPGTILEVGLVGETYKDEGVLRPAHGVNVPGNITAGLPSLGELADEDAQESKSLAANEATGNITHGVPTLMALLDEDEGEPLLTPPGPHRPGVMFAPGAEEDIEEDVEIVDEPSMDLTGGSLLLADATTGGFGLGGYTSVLEQGAHPAWGPQASPHQQTPPNVATSVEAGPRMPGLNLNLTPGPGAHEGVRAPEDEGGLDEQKIDDLVDAMVENAGGANEDGSSGDGAGWGGEGFDAETPRLAPTAASMAMRKWGHINPGEDDTSDLNLAEKGRAMMGEVTFNQIYGGNDTTCDVNLGPHAASPEDSVGGTGCLMMEELTGNLDGELQEGDGSMAALHESLQQTLRSAPSNEADEGAEGGSPTEEFESEERPRHRLSCGSVLNDLTGKLLEDDLTDGMEFGPLGGAFGASGPGGHLQEENLPFAHAAGRDATTGLLVDEEAEAAAGPLGRLARRLTELHGAPQVPVQAPVLGVIRGMGSTTQLLAGSVTLGPGGTTRLLADTTHVTAGLQAYAGSPAASVELDPLASPGETFVPGSDVAGTFVAPSSAGGTLIPSTLPATLVTGGVSGSAGSSMSPPAVQSALRIAPVSRMGRDGKSLLDDESLEDLAPPPELPVSPGSPDVLADPLGPTTWVPLSTPRRARPTPHVIPGGPLIGRTPPPAPLLSTCRPSGGRVSGGSRLGRTPLPVRFQASPAMPTAPGSAATNVSYVPLAHSPTISYQLHAIPEGPSPQSIPGGLKLARTPPGVQRAFPEPPAPLERAPSGVQSETPQVNVSQTSQAASIARTPRPPLQGVFGGGLKLARTPLGTNSYMQRGMATPMPTPTMTSSGPPPITFQDFLKEVDLQFLDHMRRGTSINFADLASDPPPATLEECYRLLYVTAPDVMAYESAIATLNEEIRGHKTRIVEKEAGLAKENPPIFQAVQLASATELDVHKESVAALKKLCRQRTMATWKGWRAEMEAHRAETLQAHVQLVDEDRSLLDEHRAKLRDVVNQVARIAADTRAQIAADEQKRQAAVRQQEAVATMQAQLAEQEAANTERQEMLQEHESRVASLKARLSVLGQQREQLQQQLAAGKAAGCPSSPIQHVNADALQAKVDELDIMAGCTGWQIERLAVKSGHGELALRFGPLFRVNIFMGPAPNGAGMQAQGYLELTRPEDAPHMSPTWREVAARLAGAHGPHGTLTSPIAKFHLADATMPSLARTVTGFANRLGRINDVLHEGQGLRRAYPMLADIAWAGNGLRLVFLNLEKQLKFSLLLHVGQDQEDLSGMCEARVHFQGQTGVTSESLAEAVTSIPTGYGRLRAACAVLHALAVNPPANSSAPLTALPQPGPGNPTRPHTPAPVSTPGAALVTQNDNTHALESLSQVLVPAEAASEVGCQTGPGGPDGDLLGNATPGMAVGGAEQVGEGTRHNEATPAPPAALSGDTVASGVGSSCVPGPSGAPSTEGPQDENDPLFSRAFSNPLFNQQTPGGFPRPN